jgi:peptidoglycan/LPS O-acetylase OafA/YrhL
MASAPDKLRYIDALRGWAILLVLLTHASQSWFAVEALSQRAPAGDVLDLPYWLKAICASAGSGVHLFFVVSALSLALSARKRQEPDWRAYFIRRFFRIAPMFYVGIALYIETCGWGARLYAPDGITPLDVALTLGFVHAWHRNSLNSVVPGDWSIGVEAMFYLILPLLLAVGRTPVRLALLTLGFVLLAQAIVWTEAPFGPFGAASFPAQAAVFLFGLVAAMAARQPAGTSGWTASGGAALAVFLFLVVGLPVIHLPDAILAYHVQFAAVASVLCILLHRAPVPILVNPLLIGLGRISFSLYILEFALLAPVLVAAEALAGPQASDLRILAWYFPLLTVVGAACATATYFVIERPGMWLGRRLIAVLAQHWTALQRPA